MKRQTQEEGWAAIFRLAKIAGLLILCGLLVAVFYPKYAEYAELQRRKEALAIELQLETEALRVLEEKQQLLVTKPDFAERVAREEFGYARPGEKVIKFIDDESGAKRPAGP